MSTSAAILQFPRRWRPPAAADPAPSEDLALWTAAVDMHGTDISPGIARAFLATCPDPGDPLAQHLRSVVNCLG